MWWSIARAALRCPPIFYCLYAIVLLTKWAVWFPIMLIRFGLNAALDAALTTPNAGRLKRGRKLVGKLSSLEHHQHSSALKFRQRAAHLLHLFVG